MQNTNNTHQDFKNISEAQVVATVEKFINECSKENLKQISQTETDCESQAGSFFSNMMSASEGINQMISAENVEKIGNILNSLNSFSNKLNSLDMKLFSKVIASVVLLYSVRDDNKSLLALAAVFVSYTYKDDIPSLATVLETMNKLTSKVTTYFRTEVNEEAIQAQSGISDLLSADIATALGLFVFGTKVDMKKSNIVNIFKDFSAVKNSLQSVTTLVLKVIDLFLENLGLHSINDKIFHFVNKSSESYVEYSNRVFEIDAMCDEKKLTYTSDNYETLKSILKEGEILLRDMPKNNTTSGLYATINGAVSRIRTYKKAFVDSGFMVEGLRQETVAVLLRGGPGTLKTQTMQHLAHALVSSVVPSEKRGAFENNPERFIYNRLVETEYWDGYDQDKIVTMIDDLLQIRDIAGGGDSEVFNVIRAVNENAYDLHMADISNKGNTKFKSEFLICTTNSADLKVQSIHDKGALLRRLKRTYTVVPKDGYKRETMSNNDMNHKVDFSKLPIGPMGITTTNPDDVLEFHEYDLINKVHTGKILTFDNLVRTLLTDRLFAKQCYLQKVSELKTRRKQYSCEAQSGFPFGMPCNFSKGESSNSQVRLFKDLDNSRMERVLEAFNKEKPCVQEMFITRIQGITKSLQDFHLFEDSKVVELLDITFGEMFWTSIFEDNDSDFEIFASKILFNDVFMSFVPVKTQNYRIRSFLDNNLNIIEKVKENIKSINESISKDSFVQTLKSWATVKTAVSTVAMLFGMFIGYTAVNKIKRITEENGPYKMRPKKAVAKRLTAKQIRSLPRAQAELSLINDPQGEDIIKKVTRSNLYEFCVTVDDVVEHRSGFVLFIKGNVAIVPHHFFDLLVNQYSSEDNCLITIKGAYNRSTGNHHEVSYTLRELSKNLYDTPALMEQDMLMVVFPNFNPRPDITKYLANMNDLDSLNKNVSCSLTTIGEHHDTVFMEGKTHGEIFVDGDIVESYTVNKTVSYRASTKKGDCGAVLGIMNPSETRRKVFGFHVAGRPALGYGYASLLNLEDIMECYAEIPIKDDITVSLEPYQAEASILVPGEGRFGSVRRVDRAPTLASKTKLIESNLYGKIVPALNAPAHLHPKMVNGEFKNPWKNAMTSYSSVIPIIDEIPLQAAVDSLKDFLFSNSKIEIERRVYSYEEAVKGIPNSEFDSINRSTSPGYPAIMEESKGSKGKTHWFSNGDEFDLGTEASKALEAEINNTISMAEQGIRDEHIFMDCLKDEHRPIEKVDAFKTRLISASPLKLLILYRQYFGAYMHWYKVNRMFNQSAIGVNVYSEESDLIVKLLSEYCSPGEKGIGAGDFKGFDGSEKPQIHNKILNIINIWYGGTPEEDKVRRVLWLELTNSIHIQGKEIYEWYSSLPSGHPLTPIVNTMYNGIAFRYCWFQAHKDTGFERKFNENCFLIALGDDNVFAVKPQFRETFTEVIVGKHMAELGLTYTSETKNDLNNSLRKVTDVEFLKRKWEYSPELRRYIAPLRIEGLFETLSWTKKGNQSDAITISNVDYFMRELSLHGKTVFDAWAHKVASISNTEIGYWPKTTSYMENLLDCTDMKMFL